jgi:hypothetical protein
MKKIQYPYGEKYKQHVLNMKLRSRLWREDPEHRKIQAEYYAIWYAKNGRKRPSGRPTLPKIDKN